MRVAVAQWIEHLIDYEDGRGFESHQSYAHQMAPDLVTGGHFLILRFIRDIAGGAVVFERCFRGRCNFEPAVIVRDPMLARYRLTQ